MDTSSPDTPVALIAHYIQLAVAPVFLLAGIAGLLGTLTARLARVIDRARQLEARLSELDAGEERMRAVDELGVLDQRMKHANRAITACTASALFVCLLVGGLFIAALTGFRPARTVAMLFIAAMTLLVAGLGSFLAEIRLATGQLRVRRELLPERAAGRAAPPRR